MKPNCENFKGCFLAGGALLSQLTKTPISDYDIYPKSEDALVDAVYQLVDDMGAFLVNKTDKALSFKVNETNENGDRLIYQLVYSDYFKSAEEIFALFDFSVCMVAYDFDTGEMIYGDHFMEDALGKVIRFNPKTRWPMNSITRLTKYRAKGYHITKPEYVKMILTAIDKGMPKSWDELEQAIGGTYGKEISLRADDLEFNLENALSILDSFNTTEFCYQDKSDEFSHLDADEIVMTVSRNGLYYPVNETEAIMIKDIRTEPELKPCRLGMIPNSWTECSPDAIVKGYKLVKVTDDEGVFKPGVTYKDNGVVYELGKTTKWDNDPYLFVYYTKPNRFNRSDKRIIEVSFRLGDIKYATRSAMQVSELTTVSVVSDE